MARRKKRRLEKLKSISAFDAFPPCIKRAGEHNTRPTTFDHDHASQRWVKERPRPKFDKFHDLQGFAAIQPTSKGKQVDLLQIVIETTKSILTKKGNKDRQEKGERFFAHKGSGRLGDDIGGRKVGEGEVVVQDTSWVRMQCTSLERERIRHE